MKKLYTISALLLFAQMCLSQAITYTFSALSGAYTTHAAATKTIEGALGPSSNDALSGAPVPIGFNFKFGCATYSQVLIASNGWLTFNMSCIANSGDPANQLAGNITQTNNFERPLIAPLWDDLDVNYIGANGEVSTQLTGAAGTRIFSVEWLRMMWSANAAGAVISFQVKLYEGTNVIDFVYRQEGTAPYAGATNPKTTASIGLAGGANGNYYSVNSTGAAPAVTNNAGEVSTLNTKPATGQIYRWTPPCTTLPIELISFIGENSGNINTLKWATASEKNNDYFILERSDNGVDFSDIAKIGAAGTTHSEKKYEFKDGNLYAEMYYYRLKQVDYGHTYSYSDIVTIKSKFMHTVTVSPNPANCYLIVKNEFNDPYVLLNASGQIIKEGWPENSRINVSELKEGLYILKIAGSFKKIIICH